MRRSRTVLFLLAVIVLAWWQAARRRRSRWSPPPATLDAPFPFRAIRRDRPDRPGPPERLAQPARPAWVEPAGDGAPGGYPVKVKLGSGIYHVPGGRSYERTRADRCYVDTAAAEADGFRAAKQ
jgi:hypothetical protein